MMAKRRYSDNDRAAALAVLDSCNGNLSEASRKTGFPLKTIADWRDGAACAEVAEIRKEKKIELSEMFEDIARQIVQAAPSKISYATLKDSMVAAGVAVDKAQLLKGQPTAITQQNADPADARRELAEYLFSRRVREDVSEYPGRGIAPSAGDDRPGIPALN